MQEVEPLAKSLCLVLALDAETQPRVQRSKSAFETALSFVGIQRLAVGHDIGPGNRTPPSTRWLPRASVMGARRAGLHSGVSRAGPHKTAAVRRRGANRRKCGSEWIRALDPSRPPLEVQRQRKLRDAAPRAAVRTRRACGRAPRSEPGAAPPPRCCCRKSLIVAPAGMGDRRSRRAPGRSRRRKCRKRAARGRARSDPSPSPASKPDCAARWPAPFARGFRILLSPFQAVSSPRPLRGSAPPPFHRRWQRPFLLRAGFRKR